jgi:hypothetical protein
MAKRLPVYKINNRFYFRDNRLGEYRSVTDPSDKIDFENVDINDFQRPTARDKRIIEHLVYGKKKLKKVS